VGVHGGFSILSHSHTVDYPTKITLPLHLVAAELLATTTTTTSLSPIVRQRWKDGLVMGLRTEVVLWWLLLLLSWRYETLLLRPLVVGIDWASEHHHHWHSHSLSPSAFGP
jgi:hypothetical protein